MTRSSASYTLDNNQPQRTHPEDGEQTTQKMAISGGAQFWLLLWKNARLQNRKKFLTVLQVIMPTLGALIFLGIRFAVSVTRYDAGRTWPSFGVDSFAMNYTMPIKLAYCPNVTVVQRIIASVESDLGIQGIGFADETAMVEAFADPAFDTTMWGGLVFTNPFNDPNAFPDGILYTLRPRPEVYAASYVNNELLEWMTELMFPEFLSPGPREPNADKGGTPEYAEEGFLTFMRAVDKALALELANSGETPERVSVRLQRFPYPPYVEDAFVTVIESQLPLLIVLGLLFTVPDLASSVTLEKEKRLKEYMKIMGLSNWLHWTAWFLKAFIMLLISVALMTILFTVQTSESAVLNAADPSVVFVFLLLYVVSCICFSFMISTFFKKASSAAGAAGLLFYLSFIPYTVANFGSQPLPVNLAGSLLNNVAMSLGCRQIALYEGSGAGVQWSNLNLPVSEDQVLTMGHIFTMLLLDSLIYLFITWYIENVFPGEFGIPRPCYFPCTREYWCGPPKTLYDEEEDANSVANLDPAFFEPLPANRKAGVSIRNLRKEFKRGKQTKVAVAGTTLDMLEGQVTALLGHNGAGKTTTMSVLTGFIPATSGTAVMNGFDIRSQMKHVRSSLGLCPQHNVLFDTLTVAEHLTFFARLKGCPSNQVKAEVTEMIRVLGLEDKAKELSKSLSGGMKRKLSMGIALIYGSKIVILDEPTSGMDPEARRKAWDILQSQREGRTVLLSTHFMDEADLLGDRIAIMAEGVVKCCGSSLFLKNKYGVGYHLVMVKDAHCDVEVVTNFILQYVPDAKLESNVSAELSYTLPNESSARFEEMFTCLEKDSVSLGIQSFGASVTTMEEVFMKVGESCHDEPTNTTPSGGESNGKADVAFTNMAYSADNGDTTQPGQFNDRDHLHQQDSTQVEYSPVEKHRGMGLLFQQFKGMFIKGMIMTWRNRKIAATQIIMPVLFTILGVISSNTGEAGVDPASRVLSVKNSADQIVAYALNSSQSSSAVSDFENNFRLGLQGSISSFKNVSSVSLESYLADLGETSMDTYSRNYFIAADIVGAQPMADGNETVLVTGLFNGQTYHAIGMAIAAIDEAVLKYVSGGNLVSLQVTNHPLPRRAEAQLEQDATQSLTQGFILAIDIIFGVSFMVATFVIFIVTEELTKAKHVQFVSGVQTGTYWLSMYSWHVINYLIPAILIMIVLLASGLDEFKGSAGGYTFLLLLLYGMAILPFTYLMSFMFTKPTTAYTWTSIINVFTGTGSIVAVFVLSIPGLGLEATGSMLRWIFYILIPNFSMGVGIQDIYTSYNNKKICSAGDFDLTVFCTIAANTNMSAPCCPDICARDDGFCASWVDNVAAWEYPGIGRSLFFLFIQIFVFFGFIFFLESGIFKSVGQRIIEGTNAAGSQNSADQQRASLSMDARPLLGEDKDVADERKNILNIPTFQLEQQNALILKELRKFYGGFLAVDRLSLGIPAGECFGLLGVNGAGKTTTFKMLTGDIPISSGDALLDGHSVKRDIKEVQRRLGYCPQFDALLDQMTVEETLYMYARLRGIPDADIPQEVTQVITSLLLQDHAKKRCSELSGGNKRKLSTAMAILGDPSVVFLDEPTTGMDPVARRSLWDTLTKVRQQGRTLVLTSHSMEECEALCTRLAIMVNGQFKCLGSVQHLKANCGEGYTLLAKVGGHNETEIDTNTHRLSAFVQEQFPGSELKDLHQGYIHYQVKSSGVSWARIFGTIERAKGEYCIEDYSVSQTTLEQVFINFARAQVPPREKGLTASQKIKNCLCFCCCCGCCKDPHENQ